METTSADILSRIENSGVFAKDELETLHSSISSVDQNVSGEKIIKELLRINWLTPFQASAIWENNVQRLVFGNYVILEELGRGGMGVVWKARHRRMQRIVALKVLPESVSNDASTIARFHREVVAAARLNHPNIVTAFDADEVEGSHFLVMEYVDAHDLSWITKKRGLLSIAQVIECVIQTARGLEYAHSQGVIHRDIKPGNLLLDNNGTVKILDMGLARFESETEQAELTMTNATMGTVDFMAPEQAEDAKSADARADIYSLGMSLYYLLIGKSAYRGDSMMARLIAHREKPIPSLCEINPKIPRELDHIFQRMVAKKIGDRIQSMTEVISSLQSMLLPMDDDAGLREIADIPDSVSPTKKFVINSATKEESNVSATADALDELPPGDPASPADNAFDETMDSAIAEDQAEAADTDSLRGEKPDDESAWSDSDESADDDAASDSKRKMILGIASGAVVLLAIIGWMIFKPAKPGKEGTKRSGPSEQAATNQAGEWKELLSSGTKKELEEFGTGTWRLENGILTGVGNGRGWIGTRKDYDDFELELEYRLAKRGNSGVFLRAFPTGNDIGTDFLEYQLLDDANQRGGGAPMTKCGALYKRAAPTGRVDSKADVWHLVRIVASGPRITGWHDGVKILETRLTGKDAAIRRGRIGFQQFPTKTEFKNIRVRELKAGQAANTPSPAGMTPAMTKLGSAINTKDTEFGPWLSPDGLTLCFNCEGNGMEEHSPCQFRVGSEKENR